MVRWSSPLRDALRRMVWTVKYKETFNARRYASLFCIIILINTPTLSSSSSTIFTTLTPPSPPNHQTIIIMKLSGVLSALTLATAASATTVSYDTGYDDGNRAMTSVACSDGKNGLITRYGFNKQSDIPRFPYIGGVYTIAGWNSPNCGSCFRVEYQGRKIHVLAIDHAGEGVNMGLRAMNDLTNGKAAQLGRINAQVYHAKPTDCGLKA